MIIRVPPSVKICVACCHIDFRMRGLTVIEDDDLKGKLENIDKFFDTVVSKPQLVVFPEGSDCGVVRGYSKKWAEKYSATVVCGTSIYENKVRGIVVFPGDDGVKEVSFEKNHLSPYDTLLAGHQLTSGGGQGLRLDIPAKAADGQIISVGVLILICYDFRYFSHLAHDYNSTQIVVVPMFDDSTSEPEGLAQRLAKRHFVRTFLVNKGTKLVSPIGGGVPWYMKVSAWICERPGFLRKVLRGILGIHSSAYGPMSAPFARYLISARVSGVEKSSNRIWRYRGEAMTVGIYEVGQSVAPGHDNAYGAGYFYTEVRHVPL